VLAEPRRSGFTSFVWLLPVVSIVIGLVVVAQVLRGWKTKRAAPVVPAKPAPAADIPPDVLERLEEELRKVS